MNKYRRQGERARGRGESRESCRYKAPEIVSEWQAGWDAADARIAERLRWEAEPRWEDTTSYSQGERGTREPDSWSLVGDVIRLNVHKSRHYGGRWIATSQAAQLYDHRLEASNAEEAQREGIVAVRRAFEEALAKIDSYADADGRLRQKE